MKIVRCLFITKKKTTFLFQLQFEFKTFTLKLHFEEITWVIYYMPIFSALPYFPRCSFYCRIVFHHCIIRGG